ncbi:MAG TPA: tetratricopeptide repeat protein [Thermoanaerobaculia bacterium]|nr:tetratricopeptide repeat protein [Thermoanaerobaculia bacterium]
MRLAARFVPLLLVCLPAAAQHFHHHADASASEQFLRSPCEKTYAKPALEPKWQKVEWKVTGKETARTYFNQGMTHYYGFNFEEAARNFRAALDEDSSMAMAAWGIALASGPNININMEGECAKQAVAMSIHADDLAKTQPGISDFERATISALRVRYERGLDPVAYAAAMRRVWTAPFTSRNDPNVTAVYAESVMDLRPWGLFDNAHRPALDTDETIRALEDALKVKDDAVGPNHLLIHAVEAGPSPAKAQHAAAILAGLVPDSGHLVHMPSHINLLLGNYAEAVGNNADAVDADKRNYEAVCADKFNDYWARPGCPAVYYGHYLGHNYFFQSVAAAFAGKSKVAIDSAEATEAHVRRFVVNEPGLQRYLTAPLMMLVAHQRWDKLPTAQPDAKCYAEPPFEAEKYWTGCHILRSVFFYAHAMRSAWQGKATDARTVYALMKNEMKLIAPKTPTGWGNNTAAAVLAVPEQLLLARIAWAEPNRKDEAIEYLKLAVTYEDAMVYDEPPQWFAPAREYLGGAYLQDGQFAKAVETFHDALGRHPRSGRALYGLMRACEKVPANPKCPADIKDQFEKAWKSSADYDMSVDKLW